MFNVFPLAENTRVSSQWLGGVGASLPSCSFGKLVSNFNEAQTHFQLNTEHSEFLRP